MTILRILKNTVIWIIIIIATVWVFFPFYWAIVTSLKMPTVILTKPSLIPFLDFQPTLSNWQQEFSNRWPESSKGVKNSAIISIGAAAIAVFLGTMAGYGLARFRFNRWKNKDMTLWFLSQRFLPPIVTVIPFFLVMKNIGLIDHQLALIFCERYIYNALCCVNYARRI
jgi:multiple sugar transport system permease protein